MPVIPQITNPFQGKGYHSSLSNNQTRPGSEQFEIIQLTKPNAVSDANERQSGKPQQQLIPNRTDLPQLMVKTPKDPTMAVETLKQLISTELLATAQANGYTELHGELEGLSKSIYLQVSELVGEMLNQEEQTTMFSGNKLFDLLRELAGGRETAFNAFNPDLSGYQLPESSDKLTAIANFLKAVNFTFNRDEILNALSANLKFLSTYFSPSPPLSEKLGALAKAWGGIQARENFELLKGETVKLLYNVSESLLNNEKTQILIPLIIHNLSRYNTNDYMIKDTFSHMLTHVPHSQKGAFIAAFDEFLNAVLFKSQPSAQPQPAQAQTESPQLPQSPQQAQAQSAQTSHQVNNNTDSNINQPPISDKGLFPTLYGEKIQQGGEFPPPTMSRDALADGLRGFLLGRLSGMNAVGAILANLIEPTVNESGNAVIDPVLYSALQSDLVKIDNITALVNYLNDILMQLPDVPERQILFEMLSETVSGMAEKGELPPDKQPSAQQQLQPQEQQPQQPQQSQQSQAQPQVQGQEQPQTQPQEQQPQIQGQEQTQSQQSQTQPQVQGQEQTLLQEQQPQVQEQAHANSAHMTAEVENKTGLTAENKADLPASSALEELTSFIEKNINHNALKTLDSYNASNLLQSLINAPGVYTPLSHFIIPLQIGGAKAFGELWVDNEEKRKSAGGGDNSKKNHHLFLTFEIESVGRFETDLYATDTEVSLAVLHPESFTCEMNELKGKINRIIASTDYSVKDFQTGVLREPHDLTQIFPRIVEKRQGLDITV
ncbi:MAG: hypothetical protein FWH07_06915 [Oscillospiraceae bacterium]|nr:hypothetical protein [Oscillospiraceae bacterium]